MRTKIITQIHGALWPLAVGLVLAGGVAVQAQAPPGPQGTITEKLFLNIGGGVAVADLTASSKFPDSPDLVNYRPYFEMYATGDIFLLPPDDVFNNSGAQILGYFYPPVTGDYVFWVSADDAAELYLSTDANPGNKKLIARETGWSPSRWYTWIGGGSVAEEKRSSTFSANEWPVKDPSSGGALITLTAGQPYYIEALQKEGGGGDNLSVAVMDPAGMIDPNLPIPGVYLSSIDKSSGPPTILSQPQSQTVNEGQPVTFSVVVDGTPPYSYQWSEAGIPIIGATDSALAIERVAAADNGLAFSVQVVNAVDAVGSEPAILTVIPDTVAPSLISAKAAPGLTTVTVTFSEPMDPQTAQVAGNYQIAGLTVLSATLGAVPNDNVVTLATSPQAEGTAYILKVDNVEDIPGNKIAPGTTTRFKSFVAQRGWATYERWKTEDGVFPYLDGFAAAIKDGTMRAPDFTAQVPVFGCPRDVADYYTARVFGWFIPPADGDYVFFVASDDGSYLYLSTDAQPANKKLIANELGWSPAYWFTWSTGASPLEAKRSDLFAGTEWPDRDPLTGAVRITLTGGQPYYMEALMVDGYGGDGVEVAFITQGQPDPPNDPSGANVLGDVIGTYVPAVALPVAVASATPVPVQVGQAVQLDGSASYQEDGTLSIVNWEWDFNNDGVFDATGPKVTTTFAAKGIFPVKLRVTDDSTPPKTAETTVEVLVANKLVPWKAQGKGQLIFAFDDQGNVQSVTVKETGVATHIGNYTETVWLTSPTTGDVEIVAANGEKLFGTLLHLSPTEVQVTVKNGTGRFVGAVGRYVARLTMTGPTTFTATATGTISTVGSNYQQAQPVP